MYTHDEGIALSLISARTLENCFCLSTGTFSFVFAMLSSLCVKKKIIIFFLCFHITVQIFYTIRIFKTRLIFEMLSSNSKMDQPLKI